MSIIFILKYVRPYNSRMPPPQLLCLIFVLSSCFILLTVIHGMGCNELGITLLEIDILCLDRASVPRQRQSSIIRLNIVKKKAEL